MINVTKKEIKEWVKDIERNMNDPEVAHGSEDELYITFIEYIRDKAPEPYSSKAKEVLKATELDYPHWTA